MDNNEIYAQLLIEVRELRLRVEELENQVFPKGQQKKKGIPNRVGIKTPWEREGIDKQTWIDERNQKAK